MGWFKYIMPDEKEVIIGDEVADILGNHLDEALKVIKLKYPGFSLEQFIATLQFASGHITIDTDYILDISLAQ